MNALLLRSFSAALALELCVTFGCSKPEPLGAPTAISAPPAHTHDGWWCNEHGVPEESCGQCDTKLAADFQKKGDWCKDHDRPDSQCFTCHPEFEAQFAAQYEAKYGKQPPKPQS